MNHRLASIQICIATAVIASSFIVASIVSTAISFRNFVVGIR